ncbi:MAG TPA: ADP-glyceromanno-heptose 6-epimerase [Acidobacteriaceae bacterium]|jgi:ADP-L-glycero-D-manno-heptose 6-epimerase|nr:ADP-glyceromanno-heptose 6-epimerase [Acidobacteriaceae bacterium]
MIVVTGGAGFIGSNLIHELNRTGETDILCVDNLTTGQKILNLDGSAFTDYMDKHEFREALASGKFRAKGVRAILHQGACSNTLVDDGAYMMDNNFTYSKELLHFALENRIPFVYASTAAVYGLSQKFQETPGNEHPLNIYGFSKLALDNYIRRLLPNIASTVVGLRYFNVYGPREQHKGRMASVIHHFSKQMQETGKIKMFEGSGGYGNGEQRRDFVYVRDLCRLNMHFAGIGEPAAVHKGIFNAGTGASRTFNDVARALMQVHGKAEIEYIPFPADLTARYQHFTEADTWALRNFGYEESFTSLETGVAETFATTTQSA